MTTWKDDRSNSEPKKRPVPQMPEGYYSGDKPNPHLREFVEKNMTPYDPEHDDYQVEPFNEAITTTKATAIYNMHTYWSKKPHDAIRQYIRHYTKPGDIVLDPFCGSGGTALAALMEGRKAIAIDRSPAATFITKNYCTPVDVDELQAAFEELKEKVKPEIDWLYETRCDRCGGKATTAYTVYSQQFRCPRCLEIVALFDCPEVEGRTLKGKPKKIRICPHCQKGGHQEVISTSGEKSGAVPVLVSYICENGCKPARGERRHDDADPKKREYFERYDLGKIQEIEGREIPHWYPKNRMMNAPEDQECWGVKWRAGTSNFRTVDELFTKRNLWALAAISNGTQDLDNSQPSDALMFGLTALLLRLTRMNQYRPDVSYPTSIITGTYYMPQVSVEAAVWPHYENKIERLMKGYAEVAKSDLFVKCIISTQSVTNLAAIPAESVDYIFTDPPYGGNVQFGELNFIWESWLNLDTRWHKDEIIVNEIRHRTENDWASLMLRALIECYRVLKPNRCLSLCYHDTSEGTWQMVQDIMAECGFVPERSGQTLFIDTGGKTYNQNTADKVTKRDLVINFRKPNHGEASNDIIITELDDFLSFNAKVCNIIRNYLESHPGCTKDHIFDEVVSRMVRRGQMESHSFEDILLQVAEPIYPEGSETQVAWWYLREVEIEDSAESAKEDIAANIIRKFIEERSRNEPEEEGVHYSDLFEYYIDTVEDMPRRKMAEWLLDYFYKTEFGTYRLPISEDEEQIKKEGRAAGLSRSIKRYLSFLEQNIPVPDKERPSDPTLAEWIRHAKRSGLYSEGKLLYEKGGLRLDRLSEEGQINVDEDYMVCTRMLSRKVEGKGKR